MTAMILRAKLLEVQIVCFELNEDGYTTFLLCSFDS